MVSEPKRPATALRPRTLFPQPAAIIEGEYDLRLSLDEVARRVATSRRQLQRAFSEAGETSFRLSVQKVRMGRAAELLRDTRTPVNAVASAVGYRQAAQFAKAFRRHHGAPPSSFRATGEAPIGAPADPSLAARAQAQLAA